MSHEIPASSFRHLLRVRLGVNGPRGRLFHCEKRDRSGYYWKVKLETGEWVWPHGLVIDGVGDRIVTCAECESPFITTDEILCRNCDEQMFGTEQRQHEPVEPSVATRRYWRDRQW